MIEIKITSWKEDFLRYCKSRKLAESTKIVYWGAIECFLRYFNTASVERINWKQIADYINQYDSARTMEQKKYAIQLFYSVCVGQENKCANIAIPQRENKIPEVLNIDECYRVFLAIENFKQRIAIWFAYCCALRISEVINAKIKNLDLTADFFFIKESKGKKDRLIAIPPDLKEELIRYLNERFPNGYTGEEYLFDGGVFKGIKKEQYSETSLRLILKRACKIAGVLKGIKFHSLRHSRATHWHNSGVMTLRDIADLLGHISTKTTEIYLHTQNEDLRDKAILAGEIIKSKLTSAVLLKAPERKEQKTISTPADILIAASSCKKMYLITMNGKTFEFTENNSKIETAPENHKWAIGKSYDMVHGWFKRKGAIIAEK